MVFWGVGLYVYYMCCGNFGSARPSGWVSRTQWISNYCEVVWVKSGWHLEVAFSLWCLEVDGCKLSVARVCVIGAEVRVVVCCVACQHCVAAM